MENDKVQKDKVPANDEISNEDLDKVAGGGFVRGAQPVIVGNCVKRGKTDSVWDDTDIVH